ncbi:MAG: gephyrin-like molybdotransferase Glp [Nitrospinota bacterium]
MISVEEALERILSYVHILEAEEKPILEAMGQVLAEDVYSPFDIPPLANSAMDGYAVQAQSTLGASEASPKVLSVIGEVAAGYLTEQEVKPGTALRIMTGASIPRGADTVVQFEHTDEEERKKTGKPLSEIGVLRETAKGTHIRPAGEDIAKGSLVLRKGTALRPQEIGVLASLGRPRVSVIRCPRVSVLATGDELIAIDEPLAPGKIYNSNTFTIASQVSRYGGIPKVLGIARDNRDSLVEKIREGLDADLFITSAGVSVGDYDVVKEVLAEQGEIAFWTVRMRPGKPLAFGVLRHGERRVPHLGLPGNPVSSMITFEQFARPALLKMLGKTNFAKPTISAQCQSRIENEKGNRIFARAVVTERNGRHYAAITGPQGSGILTSMTRANGLIIVPEEVPLVEEGDTVQVQMLDWEI